MGYPTNKDGRLRMYWVSNDHPARFLRDPVDGLDGVRKWLLEVIPDNESILDIGCGMGHVSEIFRRAARHNSYLGVDRYRESIDFAKKLFPHAQFDYQDACFLPYADNSFDHAILFTVVEMMDDFRKPIEEAVRVAKKQAIITIYRPLVEGPTQNTHTVNSFGEYVVDINRKKFLDHLNSFGHPVTSGTLEKNNKIEYWWWIIKKDE